MYMVNIDYCCGASSVRTYTTYDKVKKVYNQATENPEVVYCSVIGKDDNKLMEYANWEEAKEELNKAWNLPGMPSFEKLKIGTVIDEDKSVKWNREEVERINKEYDEEVTRLRNQKQSAINEAEKQIYELIAKCTGISIEKAPKVWSMVYADHRSGGLYEIFGALDEMCDFLYELLN